jgi:uncharacterized protein YdhG (YjbR/CyaY superfamily)
MSSKKAAVSGVDEYLAGVPEPARGTLEKLRKTIRAAAPKEATEGMSYGMPAFFHCGALVAYAAFKGHCSLFPMNGRLIEEMGEELKGYKTSKGTIQFAMEKAPPAALVRKIVKKRVEENEGKKRGR